MTKLPVRDRDNYTLKRYVGKDGKFRWNQTDKRNGEIVGGSTEGYTRAVDCLNNLYIVTGWVSYDIEQ